MSRLVRRAMAAAAMVLAAGCGVAPGAWGAGGLGLTVSGMPAQLIVGDSLTLTANVTNQSEETATDVWTHFVPHGEDPFEDPPLLTPIAAGFCVELGPSLNCNLPMSLGPAGQPGDSAEATVSVGASQPGRIAVDVGADADPGLSAMGLTWEGTVEPKADTKLTLTASAETVANGAPATIRGLASNTKAEGIAYGTAVKFSLPAGVEVVARPPDCKGTALNLTCPVGDLGPQATAGRDVTLRSTTEGSFTVLGTVTWARPDTTPIDTQGQVTVTVQPPPEAPGPPPAATPKAAAKPKTVSATTLAQGVPRSGACARSRRLSLVLRSVGSWDPVRATIRVTGRKRALVLKGARARRPFTLTLPRSGRVKLSIDVTLDNGRRYKATRTFRRC